MCPPRTSRSFVGWSDSLIGDWGRDPEETEAAMKAIFAYFAELIGMKRKEPADDQISMSLITLLAHPAQLDRLRSDLDGLLPDAVDELMRFVQLRPSGIQLGRVTTEEVELGGVTLAKGEMVLPFFQAANRDPRIFGDPNELDIERSQGTHLSFGAGLHYCLGAPLGRLELQEAFRGMLTRLPGLRLAAPVEDLKFKTNHAFYSAIELPILWDEG